MGDVASTIESTLSTLDDAQRIASDVGYITGNRTIQDAGAVLGDVRTGTRALEGFGNDLSLQDAAEIAVDIGVDLLGDATGILGGLRGVKTLEKVRRFGRNLMPGKGQGVGVFDDLFAGSSLTLGNPKRKRETFKSNNIPHIPHARSLLPPGSLDSEQRTQWGKQLREHVENPAKRFKVRHQSESMPPPPLAPEMRPLAERLGEVLTGHVRPYEFKGDVITEEAQAYRRHTPDGNPITAYPRAMGNSIPYQDFYEGVNGGNFHPSDTRDVNHPGILRGTITHLVN